MFSIIIPALNESKSLKESNYIEELISKQLPMVVKQGIALWADVFCEPGYFNIEQSKRILETGEQYGLFSRMHCDEFSCFLYLM